MSAAAEILLAQGEELGAHDPREPADEALLPRLAG
jgi:hypothetical protein